MTWLEKLVIAFIVCILLAVLAARIYFCGWMGVVSACSVWVKA